MNCTHPVLYHNEKGQLYCRVCGAVIEGNNSPGEEEKAVKTQKNGTKRKVKSTVD